MKLHFPEIPLTDIGNTLDTRSNLAYKSKIKLITDYDLFLFLKLIECFSIARRIVAGIKRFYISYYKIDI